MVEMAEKSEVNLVSVKFAPLNTQIDEALGQKIEPAFSDRDDKTIKGPDDRYLARCVFVVVCSGDEANCVRFLKELVAYQPIIRVIGTEIKGELPAQKTMTLQLESYATVGAETKEKARTAEKLGRQSLKFLCYTSLSARISCRLACKIAKKYGAVR